MEDSEKKLFVQELDKSRELNEALGMGIGIFQVCGGLRNLIWERSTRPSECITVATAFLESHAPVEFNAWYDIIGMSKRRKVVVSVESVMT